jgi:cell division protein FtsI (penicillin-binding protein 3)
MSPAVLRQLRISLAGQRTQALGLGRERLGYFLIGFLVLSAVLTGRLAELALLRGDTQTSNSSESARRPLRLDITDRNGVVMATSLKVYSLAVNPRMITNAQPLAEKINRILPSLSEAKIVRDLTRRNKFVWIKRKITPRQVSLLNALGEPGLQFITEYERVYPNGMMAAHALGYTNVDGEGIAGLENFFDKSLAKRGSDAAPTMKLTIDSRVQHALEDEIRTGMEKFAAIGGFGVVMDVNTGAVVAMASLPGFDPNVPTVGNPQARFSHVTKGVYELGSTFKAFAVAQALDIGTTNAGERWDCTAPLKIAGYRIDDFHAKRRWMTTTDVFIHSSNIGTARLIDEVGGAQQRDFLDKLGMLQAPPIELPEVGKPILPQPWGRLATMTVAYGHGMATTPLQLATGMSALVNGGYKVNPHLITRDFDARPRERVISQNTSDQMRALFRLAVVHGTGGFSDVDGYRVGGKTGTAEKPVAGGYSRSARISTFAAAFPMDAPRYVVIMSLDEPKGNASTGGYATAGMVSAPLVHNLILRSAPVLGVAKSDSDVDFSAFMPYVANPKKKKNSL